MIKKMNKTKNQRFLVSPYRRSHMNKRGGHVGIVLSFVIFVTFLVFLYTITEPATRVERGKQDLLKFLKVELINNFTREMTKAIIDVESGKSCIKIPTSEIDSALIGLGVIGKDSDGNLINTFVENNKININWDEGLLELYFSEEFSAGENLNCNSREFKVKLVRTTEEIFENKIIELAEFINENKENYEAAKEVLKIPAGDEFGFIFEDSERNVIVETQEEEVTTNIFVEEIPIQYIDNQANKKPGFLKIKVW